MADIAALKKRRGPIKGACTRIANYVAGLREMNNEISAGLSARLAKLDVHWAEYEEIQTKIELVDERELDDRIAFEDSFYALSAKIRTIIDGAHAPAPAEVPNNAPLPVANQVNNPDTGSNVRLPRIDLPRFSGNYDEWYPFQDAFNLIIHSNTTLSNVQKFQSLKSSLGGEALDLIQALSVTNDNYPVAWSMVNERYNNLRMIVQDHTRAILNLPSVSKDNAVSLRQLLNGVLKHVRALEALNRPTNTWDDILVSILFTKLDPITLREWETTLSDTNPITFKQLTDYLEKRCRALESVITNSASHTSSSSRQVNAKPSTTKAVSHAASVQIKCISCNGNHPLHSCKQFLKSSVDSRIAQVRKSGFCTNCLRSRTHQANQCMSGTCRVCDKKHNTLLHFDKNKDQNEHTSEPTNELREAASVVSATTHNCTAYSTEKTVLLSTAVVYVFDNAGKAHECRALLDNGSQVCFATNRLIEKLNLETEEANFKIVGINQASSMLERTVNLRLKSRLNSYSATIKCLILPEITDKIPGFSISKTSFNIPSNLKLADPKFDRPAHVDLLLGAEIFWELLCVGQVRLSKGMPVLQKTQFGWVLTGKVDSEICSHLSMHALCRRSKDVDLHQDITKFWEIEHPETAKPLTKQERDCERHFLKNVTVNSEGRLIVSLPVNIDKLSRLGESKSAAEKRLCSIERKFRREQKFKELYVSFMKEYILLGHMKRIDHEEEHSVKTKFYLPHHGVLKTSNVTTRLRVVFDGSAKSSTGISLNDVLPAGPSVQEDLFSIMLRFRIFKYVLTADVEKMYRQVLISEDQTCLQRILWRENETEPISIYELSTVTYGTKTASYLATRAMKYIAELSRVECPMGSRVIERDFYVDDLLTGADSLEEAKLIRDECSFVLSKGGFT